MSLPQQMPLDISKLKRGDIVQHLVTGDGWEVVSDARQDHLGWVADLRRQVTCTNPDEWVYVTHVVPAEHCQVEEVLLEVEEPREAKQSRIFWLRFALLVIALSLLTAIVLLPSMARAATSAEVEQEIAGAFERSEFSAAEQWALAGMVLADIAGNESTIDALNRGCRESNPLYGSRPNRAALYGVDAIMWGAYWWAAKRPGWKVEWFGYARGVLSARQAWSNYRTEC